MKNQYIIYVILLFSFQSIAQIKELDFDEKMEMKSQHDKYSWAYKNVFLDYKLSGCSEIFVIPRKEFTYLKSDYIGDTSLDTVQMNDKGIMFTIFGITMEPRINLVSLPKSTLYLKFPLSFSLSITSNGSRSGDMGITNKNSGAFNIVAPALIGFSKGLNSTYSNSSKVGFAISAGYQFIHTPLLGGKVPDSFVFDDLIPVGEAYEQRKNFTMPVIQLDYYKLTKKNKIRGYSLAFCPYGNVYFKLAMNFVGTKK